MEVKEIKNKSRHIQPETERMLWARSAGVCEFLGCTTKLYTHHVTKENVNLAEKAHIYAFSQGGKRYSRLIHRDKINDFSNLMLVCESCHKLIDNENTNYTAEELLEMKKEHEARIEKLVNIKPDLKSEVVIYNANIANKEIKISDYIAMEAITPEHYPFRTNPINLSPQLHLYDNEEGYWAVLEKDLERAIAIHEPLIRDHHISLFAIAPQPLLFKLGYLLNRNYNIDVRQSQGGIDKWRWQDDQEKLQLNYGIIPGDNSRRVTITVELTAKLSDLELKQIFNNQEIHRITTPNCSPQCIKTYEDLEEVKTIFRQVLNNIREKCTPNIHIDLLFIAPASVSIEAGRQLMKGDPTVTLYDRNYKTKKWCQALTLNGMEEK